MGVIMPPKHLLKENPLASASLSATLVVILAPWLTLSYNRILGPFPLPRSATSAEMALLFILEQGPEDLPPFEMCLLPPLGAFSAWLMPSSTCGLSSDSPVSHRSHAAWEISS
ncbi:hypothetical protein LIER_14621 [Lithospermum erythrorhizon]|uniref:Uncharacterized protein n=1 Tax=Lithospermum erythrorhizon TaxID=34254 RepID=A0AAV3Q229_LITER